MNSPEKRQESHKKVKVSWIAGGQNMAFKSHSHPTATPSACVNHDLLTQTRVLHFNVYNFLKGRNGTVLTVNSFRFPKFLKTKILILCGYFVQL